MLARDLAEPFPAVRRDEPALEAARLMVAEERPGLIVVDDHQHPVAVLSGVQVLKLLIPGYIRDDPTLAAVLDGDFHTQMCEALEGRSVAEVLPKERARLPLVPADHSVLEVAALMAAEASPLVAVVDGKGDRAPLIGAITLSRVMAEVVPNAG